MSVPPTVVTDEASLNLAIQAFDAFTVANTYTIDIGNNITEGIDLYAINNAHTNISLVIDGGGGGGLAAGGDVFA